MSFFKKNRTVNIFRFTTTNNKEAYGNTAVYSQISAGIFPASTNTQVMYPDLPIGQTYDIFIYDKITLQKGDKLTDTTTGDSFIIQGAPLVYDTSIKFFIQVVGLKVIGS
jgi:hypothetical protein